MTCGRCNSRCCRTPSGRIRTAGRASSCPEVPQRSTARWRRRISPESSPGHRGAAARW
jgi:hypothetical protein